MSNLETRKRSIAKIIGWRIIASSITTMVVYVATGDISTAFKFAGIDQAVKLMIQYGYERMWNKISWGINKNETPMEEIMIDDDNEDNNDNDDNDDNNNNDNNDNNDNDDNDDNNNSGDIADVVNDNITNNNRNETNYIYETEESDELMGIMCDCSSDIEFEIIQAYSRTTEV